MKLDVGLTVLVFSIGAILEWNSAASSGSLYECHHESGKSLYTDSPAQLDQCKPVQFGQPHNVANPSSATVASQSDEPPGAPTPAVGDNSPVSQPANPDGAAVSGPPSAKPGCPIGINPINPFSAPPCSQQ